LNLARIYAPYVIKYLNIFRGSVIRVRPFPWLKAFILIIESYFGVNSFREVNAVPVIFGGGEDDLAQTQDAGVYIDPTLTRNS